MSNQAHFEEIQKHIIKELEKATDSVYIAVAWFTDPVLLFQLEKLVSSGIKIIIILMDDEINKSVYGLNYSKFEQLGGKVLFINNQENKRTLMHNKFCIIDNSILITGSYNWSRRAQSNHENIVIIRENLDLVNEFLAEFNSLSKLYGNDQILKHFPLDYRKISIRLVSIKNAILLEDEEDIKSQSYKLNNLIPSISEQRGFEKLKNIVAALKENKYSLGTELIELFLSELRQLVKYQSPEFMALKLEEKNIKHQIVLLEDEKIQLNKTIRHFEIKHDKVLGFLILKILKIQKENAKKNNFAEAEEKYNSYKENYDTNKNKTVNELDEQEQINLKKLFRKAAILCHPDKVQEEFHKDAAKVYIELTEAYEQNNIKKVEVLLENLKNGVINLKNEHKENIELKKLNAKVKYLNLKRDELISEIINLKESKTYLTISIIDDWDDYLSNQKEKLELQLELLNMEING